MIIDQNVLRLPKDSPQNGPSLISLKDGVLSTKQLEIQTRFFPYTTQETFLFSNEQSQDLTILVDEIKKTFSRIHETEMGEDVYETCLAVCTS